MYQRDSLKSDLLPSVVKDKTYAYDLKDISNNFNTILSFLLGNSMLFNRTIIRNQKDWNGIQPDTISLVTEWNGPNAPQKMPHNMAGILFTFYTQVGGINYTGQLVMVPNYVAYRIENVSDWNYSKPDTSKLDNTLTSLGNSINSLSDQTRTSTASLSASTNNRLNSVASMTSQTSNSDKSESTSLAHNVQSLSTSAASCSKSASSMASAMTSNASQIKSLSSKAASANDLLAIIGMNQADEYTAKAVASLSANFNEKLQALEKRINLLSRNH